MSPQEVLQHTVAVIPVLNEAKSIEIVLDNLARADITRAIVGIDPNNTDNIKDLLAKREVPYVITPRSGYDSAVSAAVEVIPQHYPECQYILFSDAGNKYSYMVIPLFASALSRGADMALGNRINAHEHLLWHQRLGTQLVLLPITMHFGVSVHDLGPVRMTTRALIEKLNMQPRMFRWPTESLIKALAVGAVVVEVPMTLTPRIGSSKVSGSLRRSLRAGFEMYSALRFFAYRIVS